MKVKIVGQDEKDNKQNITPSTRDLMSFISPNPSAKNSLLYFNEETSTSLPLLKDSFASWEAKDPCAIIVDTSNSPTITLDNYLEDLIESVEAPIIRYQKITDHDEIFDSRLLKFDGQITSISHLDQKSYGKLDKLGEGIHFRIIPSIETKEDWQIVLPNQPLFIHVSEKIDSIPTMVKEGRFFLIGSQNHPLASEFKCQMESISQS